MGDCWFLNVVAVLTETSKVLGFSTKGLGHREVFTEKRIRVWFLSSSHRGSGLLDYLKRQGMRLTDYPKGFILFK